MYIFAWIESSCVNVCCNLFVYYNKREKRDEEFVQLAYIKVEENKLHNGITVAYLQPASSQTSGIPFIDFKVLYGCQLCLWLWYIFGDI